MGRIMTQVSISNPADPSKRIQCEALVDTGSAGLVLPTAWKSRFGSLPLAATVQMETADQRIVSGEVCGPVTIQIDGFRPVSGEVTFLEMVPKNGDYEPLLGYIILEQSQASVDMARDRLVPVKYVDLKRSLQLAVGSMQSAVGCKDPNEATSDQGGRPATILTVQIGAQWFSRAVTKKVG